MDPNTCPCALRQGLGKLLAHAARPINVRFQVDRLLRAAYGIEHGGKNLISVIQAGDPVAAQQWRTEQLSHGAEELGIINPI